MGQSKMVTLGAAATLTATALVVSWKADAAPAAPKVSMEPVRTSTAPSACVEIGPDGRQIWRGPARNAAALKLGDAHDEVSGVAMCTDYQGAAIFVSHPAASVLDAIHAEGVKYPGAHLFVQNVASGLTAQLAASQRVVASDPSAVALVGLGPNIYTGGLRVAVRRDHWPLADPLREKFTSAATDGGRVDMPVNFDVGEQSTNAPLK
jgi:hypothetical protein